MQEFDNLIKYCAQEYGAKPFCSDCVMSQCRKCSTNNCNNCLAHIHLIRTNNEHYSCEKITYNYVLKYGYRYVTEMGWAFYALRDLFDLSRPISIFSIGCGPSTELYAAAAVYKNTPLFYYGFDLNDKWSTIQCFNVDNFKNQSRTIKYYQCDFIKFVKENNLACDILVLNYFLSDFVKYQPQDCELFLKDLVALIQQGRFATIIINDVMLMYNTGTGYACMERIARSLKPNQDFSFLFQRRHFAQPNEYQFEYGTKLKDGIGFKSIHEEAEPFGPFESCGSIQLLIRTIKKQNS